MAPSGEEAVRVATRGGAGEPSSREEALPVMRERLLQAAETVLAERGYHGARVDDVVRRARASKGAFYHYFSSKEELLLELIDRFGGLLAQAMERALAERRGAAPRVEAALASVLTTLAEHRDLAWIVLVEAPVGGAAPRQRQQAVKERLIDRIRAGLDELAGEGRVAVRDTETVATVLLGMLEALATRWLMTGRPADLKASLEEVAPFALRGIGLLPAAGRPGPAGRPGEAEETQVTGTR
ncbi:MAG: TetR/AcrR family transcriptional regulator [Bacillota bacterium]|nr:TetR/AcrR family transcriptional regulator [Bacillota bacterium]